MVAFKSFLTTSVALIAAFITVEASVSPTYPSPGTIQTEGQSYDITWTYDGKNPSTTYQIDFMTGSNDVQTVLSTVATKVDPSALKYTFVAPEVTPHAAVYFFMFTGSDKVSAWTTRFGIVGADGKLVAESEQVQPNGDKIPWGNGKLVSSGSSANTTTSTTAANNTTEAAVIPAASAASSASSTPVVEVAAITTPASTSANATVIPVVTSPVASVAQVAAASTTATSGASMVKPALTFVSAAVVGYFAL